MDTKNYKFDKTNNGRAKFLGFKDYSGGAYLNKYLYHEKEVKMSELNDSKDIN